jgi:hypothetical protein
MMTYFSRHNKTPDKYTEQKSIVLEVNVVDNYEARMQEKRESYYPLGLVIQTPTTQPKT